ncbi:AMP-binding protein [Phytohabitans suffuscus]|nr:AMP-binding protein [Phytohabitans suffuscus]
MEDVPGAWLGERFRSTEDLKQRAARLAAGLASLGVAPGSTVLLIARNSFLPIEVALAAGRGGLRVVPVTPHTTGQEVEYLAGDSGAVLTIGDADLLRRLRGSLGALRILAQRTPPEVASAFGIAAADVAVPDGALDYEAVIAEASPRSETAAPAMDASMTSLFYTSGTTGRPKGIVRPAASPDQLVRRRQTLARCYGLDGATRGLVCTPMCHMLGSNFTQATLALGGTVVVMPRFDAEQFLHLVDRHRVTSAPMVPTMFVRLLRLATDVRESYSIATLGHVLHTGAPCPPAVKRAMIEWWGPILWEQYGSSETGVVTLCDSYEWLAHPGTVGRPFLGSVIRVYDNEGNLCPPGVPGEIYARMPGMPDFTYLGRPQAREAIERDGLITGGDIGEVDADGYLYLRDRRSDLVISGGNNVYPAEVEAVLGEHRAVADCAVFGVPDDEFGQRVVAAVALRPGSDTSVVDEFRPFLRERVAGYKVPREFVVVSQLPRSDAGKLLRRQVREQYEAYRAVT